MKIKPTSENVRISGRTTWLQDTLYLGFSGSFIEFTSESGDMQICLCSDQSIPEEIYLGWAAVYLDDEKKPALRIPLTQPEQIITLFQNRKPEKRKIRLVKMSEAAFGSVGVRYIQTEGETPVFPTAGRERKIEFIGDSITCGYGNEGVLDRDVFCTAQENPEEAYAILTAEALDAEYQLVSWSGIGIITDWVPETVNEPLEEILMPELYRYRDLRLAEKKKLTPAEWDFREYQPDLIVINLGTNDDSYVRTIPERQAYFGERYLAFLEQVHSANAGAAILCILGVMGQNLCEEEESRVKQFRAEHPEVRIDFLKLPEQQEEDGIGADFHPSKVTHQKTAGLLTKKIQEFMGW